MANTITDRTIKTTGGPNDRVHVMGWEDIFPDLNNVVVRSKPKRKLRELKDAEWYRLQHDTNFEGITFKAGSLFKFWETKNFGWVVFHPSSMTPEGSVPHRTIFKY